MNDQIITAYGKYLQLERNLSKSRANLHIEVLDSFIKFLELENYTMNISQISSPNAYINQENHGGC